MAILGKSSGLLATVSVLLAASNLAIANTLSLASTTAPTSIPSTLTSSVTNTRSTSSTPSNSRAETSTAINNPIPELPEYTWVYPAASSIVNTLVNGKDTIQLLWNLNYPYNPPTLSIHCWFRNLTTTSPNGNPLPLPRKPDLQQQLRGLQPLNQDFTVNMTDFAALYNPCQFFLEDSTNASLTRGIVGSAIVEIVNDKKVPAKNWTAENEAPVSTAWPTSGSMRVGMDGRAYQFVAAWSMLLVAFGMGML